MKISIELGRNYRAILTDGREITFVFTGGRDLTVECSDNSIKSLNDMPMIRELETLD